ncbi:hypothetical protein E3N88_00210 [Mikania micrantha]|uniref:Uncharacterized protein n=1 Tax=Mikania micrantha TaxID=192012 RepID=A0A5N6PXE3_9ASTR|nr:hypothetical protein E3N88_00210 [Mikania micrantha]
MKASAEDGQGFVSQAGFVALGGFDEGRETRDSPYSSADRPHTNHAGFVNVSCANKEFVESFAWTPRTPKSVEKRRRYARLKFGFLVRERVREFEREKGLLAEFNEGNDLL